MDTLTLQQRADLAQQGEVIQFAPSGLVYLDGVPIPVESVRYVNLARFEPKFTFGDYNLDSDSLISSWIQGDWRGGGQAEDLDEGGQQQRYWFSTLETRYAKQLTLATESLAYTPTGAGNAMPVGDLGGVFWVVRGTQLSRWDGTAFVAAATLASPMLAKAGIYQGKLYIPHGAAGYSTWDGTTLVAGIAGITPIAFALWDEKLIALEHDGQLSNFNGTAWTSPANSKLDASLRPRTLVVFRNQRDEPALFVVTDRDMWVHDPTTPRLFRTGLNYPPHPESGRAAAVWSDTDMYVSVGVGVHRYGGVISAMGLDQDDGLPPEYLGTIVDFEPEYNALFALIEGANAAPAIADPGGFEAGLYKDEEITFGAVSAASSLQMWNGTGWHTAWVSSGATGVPTFARVTTAGGDYALWFGYGTEMYRLPLRKSFHNPKQGRRLGIDRFSAEGYLNSGRFDGSMKGYTKLASHFLVQLDHATATERVGVYYRTDRNPAMRLLGEVSTPGETILRFGVDAENFSRGEAFGWIEFEYRLVRGATVTQTPVMEFAILKFLKLPSATTASWVLPVPVTFDDHLGLGPKETMKFLDLLTTSEAFYPFTLGDRTYRVRVAQNQGVNRTGLDERGNRLINLVEVGTVS